MDFIGNRKNIRDFLSLVYRNQQEELTIHKKIEHEFWILKRSVDRKFLYQLRIKRIKDLPQSECIYNRTRIKQSRYELQRRYRNQRKLSMNALFEPTTRRGAEICLRLFDIKWNDRNARKVNMRINSFVWVLTRLTFPALRRLTRLILLCEIKHGNCKKQIWRF